MTDLIASDAGRWTMVLIVAVATALVAVVADRRRVRRKRPDDVGFMPWTAVFLLCFLVGAVAAMRAATLWLSPA